MHKTKLRIAEIKGKGIKKRCRKEDFICFQAVGIDDNEAIENLAIKIKKESANYKSWDMKKEGAIYDCLKCERGFISHSLFPMIRPEENNYITFDYIEEVKFK